MKRYFLSSFLILSLLLFSCSSSSHQQQEINLLIENIQIIYPESGKTITGYVAIKENKIIDIGTDIPSFQSKKVIDGTGKFLIPGLIDSHVHLANVAGMNGKFNRKYPDLVNSYYQQLPKSYLYFGYTTLIDLNNYNPKVLDHIKQQEIRPAIYTCGEQLEVRNGFMMSESPKEKRFEHYPHFLYDHYNELQVLPDSIPLQEHSATYLVNQVIEEENGICVKTLFENGFGGTEKVIWEMPSSSIIQEVVTAAHQQQIPVLLHANSYESQQFALASNVDIIAHGMWHWGLLSDYLMITDLPETHHALLKQIAQKQIGYQPTFRVIAGQRDVFDDKFIDDIQLQHVYPSNLLNWLHTEEGKWQQQLIRQYAKAFFDNKTNLEIIQLMQSMVNKIATATKTLEKYDGHLLFGSDTPASNAHTNPPGYNGYLEMLEWHQAGIPLSKILAAATINNAKTFHLDHLYGSIELGKIANLLILSQNPLHEIQAYNTIEQVIINGELIKRQALSAQP